MSTKKIILFSFIISLLFKPLWLFNNTNLGQPADDMYHWFHSATLAIDQDIDYTDDYNLQNATLNELTNVPSAPPGAGYLSSVFVFLFSFFDDSELIKSEEFRLNPTKSFSYLGFFIAGMFYTFVSFYLLKKIISKNKYSTIILFCAFLSTLVHFVTTRFLMPHAVEFFLCSLILYLFEHNKQKKLNSFNITILLISYFFLSLTRPSTFLYTIILFLIYRDRLKFEIKNFTIISPILLIFIFSYTKISNLLYSENYMFLNTYGSDMDAYTSTINIEQIILGILKLPNLFLSSSMGVIWSTPIVFFGLLSFFKEYFSKKKIGLNSFLYFIYFAGSSAPLLIWQGREVAYGQRLLVGILPICLLFVSRNIKNFNFIKLLIYPITAITYIGYLFFYSSSKLTLFKGETLWGTTVGFVGQNYYIELVKGVVNIENIISVLLRNIYSVNFFKFVSLENLLLSFPNLNNFSSGKVNKFISFASTYQELSINYLFIATAAIFTFSILFAKLIIEQD